MATIKRIQPHVITHCTLCKAEGVLKVLAKWRLTHSTATGCDKHKPTLQAMSDKRRQDRLDPSEADYQTWLRV